LHEGTKVQMLENVGEWTQVKIADGKQAWLKKENILEI
jgi:SH3-like domain-containing protein